MLLSGAWRSCSSTTAPSPSSARDGEVALRPRQLQRQRQLQRTARGDQHAEAPLEAGRHVVGGERRGDMRAAELSSACSTRSVRWRAPPAARRGRRRSRRARQPARRPFSPARRRSGLTTRAMRLGWRGETRLGDRARRSPPRAARWRSSAIAAALARQPATCSSRSSCQPNQRREEGGGSTARSSTGSAAASGRAAPAAAARRAAAARPAAARSTTSAGIARISAITSRIAPIGPSTLPPSSSGTSGTSRMRRRHGSQRRRGAPLALVGLRGGGSRHRPAILRAAGRGARALGQAARRSPHYRIHLQRGAIYRSTVYGRDGGRQGAAAGTTSPSRRCSRRLRRSPRCSRSTRSSAIRRARCRSCSAAGATPSAGCCARPSACCGRGAPAATGSPGA